MPPRYIGNGGEILYHREVDRRPEINLRKVIGAKDVAFLRSFASCGKNT